MSPVLILLNSIAVVAGSPLKNRQSETGQLVQSPVFRLPATTITVAGSRLINRLVRQALKVAKCTCGMEIGGIVMMIFVLCQRI